MHSWYLMFEVVNLRVAWLDYMKTSSDVTLSRIVSQSSSNASTFINRCYAQAAVGEYHVKYILLYCMAAAVANYWYKTTECCSKSSKSHWHHHSGRTSSHDFACVIIGGIVLAIIQLSAIHTLHVS